MFFLTFSSDVQVYSRQYSTVQQSSLLTISNVTWCLEVRKTWEPQQERSAKHCDFITKSQNIYCDIYCYCARQCQTHIKWRIKIIMICLVFITTHCFIFSNFQQDTAQQTSNSTLYSNQGQSSPWDNNFCTEWLNEGHTPFYALCLDQVFFGNTLWIMFWVKI